MAKKFHQQVLHSQALPSGKRKTGRPDARKAYAAARRSEAKTSTAPGGKGTHFTDTVDMGHFTGAHSKSVYGND